MSNRPAWYFLCMARKIRSDEELTRIQYEQRFGQELVVSTQSSPQSTRQEGDDSEVSYLGRRVDRRILQFWREQAASQGD